MARRLSWSDVRGGVIATVAVVLLASLTLKYSRLGALHGDTFRLYALVGEARGVLRNSEVWLSGQKVGKVTGIRFLSPAEAGADSRLELKLELLEAYRGMIRHDAVAQVRNGGSLIGAPVVYLSPGTLGARLILEGDTVKTQPQTDTEGAAGQFGVAAKEFPVIVNNAKIVMSELKSTEGTIGAILNAPEGSAMHRLGATKSEASRLMRTMSQSGTMNPDARDQLVARAKTAMARSDSVRALVASKNTSLGRLRSDSTLAGSVADLRNELSIIKSQLDGSVGTAGRMLNDSALVAGVHGAEAQMSALFADIKRHPLRYIRF